MPHQLRMPSLGQTTDELRIVAWLKAEGDGVTLGEPILEVGRQGHSASRIQLCRDAAQVLHRRAELCWRANPLPT